MSESNIIEIGASSTLSRTDMILTTLEAVPNSDLQTHLGLVEGVILLSSNPIAEFKSGIKNYFGSSSNYGLLETLNEARNKAIDKMVDQAKSAGANAIVGIKFENLTISFAAIEVRVYGTAVKVAQY